jgi:predicted aconitase with swiveling domain/8-oxo-dGTP pyrophosphatase MutT (NUDIX family)
MSVRRIRSGKASGKAVACSCPVSFLGGVDPVSGNILESECDSKGLSISGKVFCFPFGKGSTVGSYAMYQLRLNDKAPAAIVNNSAEPIIATGAIIAEIPMVDGADISLFRTGDDVVVDADAGRLQISNVTEKHVVTVIVRSRGKILLLRRSGKVGSYRGQWAGVSGFIEHDEGDEEAARRELLEEINMPKPSITKKLEPQMFRDGDTVWCVHPFLVDAKDPKVRTDWEHEAYEWVAPKDVSGYSTVPGLQLVICKLLDL